jgi:GT2 family glycosyltransferase
VQVTRDPPLRTTWKTAFPLVSIIIPTRGDGPLLKRGLQSLIRRTAYARFEVIIVQSGEGAKVLDRLEGIAASAPGLRVLESPDPFNYSQVNNRAADQANGEVLLFLNDDVEIIDEDWLEELARWVMLPEIGVVGAKLLYPNRMIQHLGVVVGLGGHAGHLFLGAEEGDEGPFGSTEWYRDVTAVTGACLMIERDTFQAVGGFDEAYELAFGDIDLCLRVREHGLRVMVTPFARLIHHEGATRGRYTPYPDMQHGAEALMALIHRGDPHFNPNLSYASTYPRIVQEPEDRVARLRSILDRAAPREERAA